METETECATATPRVVRRNNMSGQYAEKARLSWR
jgi:hypothetical protein